MKAASEMPSTFGCFGLEKLFASFSRCTWALSRMAAGFAALVIVAMTLHILVEIGLRTVLSTSTFALDEMVGYGIAAATFLGLGYAFEHSSLVRVGLVVERLSGIRRRILDAFCALATLAVMVPITWHYIGTAMRSFVRGRVSSSVVEVPLWIPELICAFGLAVFSLQMLDFFFRQIRVVPGPVAEPDDDMQKDL